MKGLQLKMKRVYFIGGISPQKDAAAEECVMLIAKITHTAFMVWLIFLLLPSIINQQKG